MFLKVNIACQLCCRCIYYLRLDGTWLDNSYIIDILYHLTHWAIYICSAFKYRYGSIYLETINITQQRDKLFVKIFTISFLEVDETVSLCRIHRIIYCMRFIKLNVFLGGRDIRRVIFSDLCKCDSYQTVSWRVSHTNHLHVTELPTYCPTYTLSSCLHHDFPWFLTNVWNYFYTLLWLVEASVTVGA